VSTDDQIVAKVVARVDDPRRRLDLEYNARPLVPLADSAFLEQIESEVGFHLPSLLKRLYHEVGDGGFGHGYGLFGAKHGHWKSNEPFTLADLYHTNHKGTWPDKLLPICDWGCGLCSCINCSREEFPMVMSDPNYVDEKAGMDRHAFIPEGVGFRDWIEAWADGVDLWHRFEQHR
jgi:hypothetical protein